jgi:protein SCO1/2
VALYSYRWSWTDELGQEVSFAKWRGSPLLVAPIYTSCSQVCPFTIAKLRRVHDASLRRGRAIQVVLVTFDPSRDTAERLRAFKESEKLPSGWHLLRGSEASTTELLDALDLHIIDMGSHIVHETKIAVFDAQGILTRRFSGVDFEDDAALL